MSYPVKRLIYCHYERRSAGCMAPNTLRLVWADGAGRDDGTVLLPGLQMVMKPIGR